MKLLKFISTGLILSSILISCSKDEVNTVADEQPSNEINYSNKETSHLLAMGFDPKQTVLEEVELPGGAKSLTYVYKDMSFPAEALGVPFKEEGSSDIAKQFRTNNLAFGNKTYTIAFFNFAPGFQRDAARRAVNRFNNVLGTTVRLNLVFANESNATSTPRDIAVIFRNIGGNGSRGRGEFPSNNRPGKLIQLNSNTNLLGTTQRLMNTTMHEIGHNFGIRHSDFGFTGEPANNNRIPIPGTDTSGFDSASIMASGSTRSVFGTYTNNDIRAMRFLYGTR